MTRVALVSFALLGLGAAGCSTYSVRRAALVPNLQPSARDGQPIGDSTAEVSAGTAGLAHFYKPKEAAGANAGIALPRAEVNAAARFRANKNFDVGLLWDQGFDSGAISISEDQPMPKGDVYGAGVSLYYAAHTLDPYFSLGVGADLLFYSIPFVEYRTCVTNCLGKYTLVDHDRNTIPVISLAILPSYRLTPLWTVFGGVTARNHPTIDKAGIEGPVDLDEEVKSGPMNYIFSVGIERTIYAGVRAAAILYQPVSAEPVRYGPVLGVNVSVPLGREAGSAAPAPPPPPPGPAQPSPAR